MNRSFDDRPYGDRERFLDEARYGERRPPRETGHEAYPSYMAPYRQWGADPGPSPRHSASNQEKLIDDYTGRGPKNYVRSDERIGEDIHMRLTWNPNIDASEVEVTIENGNVTLSGRVADRRTRRRIEEEIEEISGVRDIDNRLQAPSQRR